MLFKSSRRLSLSLGLVFTLSSCQLIPLLSPDEPGEKTGTEVSETSPGTNRPDAADIIWSANPGQPNPAPSSPLLAPSVMPSQAPEPVFSPEPIFTPPATPESTPLPAPTVEPEDVLPPENVEDILIFENGNILAVQNGPTAPTTFMIETPVLITYFENYHWNSARGAEAGYIAFEDEIGIIYGPWPVETRPGQGGVPNAYWFTNPDTVLPAGTYTVVDSSPETWAHNAGNGYQGMTIVRGIPQESEAINTADEVTFFENGNILAVQNGPLTATTFMLEAPVLLTYFENYHWNSAQGKPGGSIGLERSDGTIYGPWPVATRDGQGGVPNAYWFVMPNIILPAGDYTVFDSDPASWAHNANNGYRGMTTLKGVPQ